MFRKIILAAVLGLVATLGVVHTQTAQASNGPSPVAQVAKKGCGDPSTYCRIMGHVPGYYSTWPGVKIKCGGVSTQYWLIKGDVSWNVCPGSTSISAINSQLGLLFWCVDGNTGVVQTFGHTDGSWQNLSYPPGAGHHWNCHRIYPDGSPAGRMK